MRKRKLITQNYGIGCHRGLVSHQTVRHSYCYVVSSKSQRKGKEKESRLWKTINRHFPHKAITFHGIFDAVGRLVWGVGNMKRFRRRGKVFINSGVFFREDCPLARAIWHEYSDVPNVYWR